MPVTPKRQHAIVIGASIAGLLAARVLADHFDRVTVLDRDSLPDQPEFRPGVPQAHHFHALLARGQLIIEGWFPGLSEELTRAGAPVLDWGRTMKIYAGGHWTSGYQGGIITNLVTRIHLEWHLRQRLSHMPSVSIIQRTEVTELLTDADQTRICGVRTRSRADHTMGQLVADLVIDASGRGSKAPEWYRDLGYNPPEETLINSYIGYATRWYEARDSGDWAGIFVPNDATHGSLRGGGVFRTEGNRMILSLGGVNKDYPPTDEEGFMDYVRSLPTSAIYDAIKEAKPISPIYGYRYEGSRRRHYETLTRRPENFLITGDAVCSFNPIYGQGMSVAAIDSQVLSTTLKAHSPDEWKGLAANFQKALSIALDDAWLLATGEDLRYPGTEGKRPGSLIRLVQRYTDQVLQAAAIDPYLAQRFHRVMNMVDRPIALFSPSVAWHVLRHQVAKRRATGPQSMETTAIP